LKFGAAAILNQNLIFEMTSNNLEPSGSISGKILENLSQLAYPAKKKDLNWNAAGKRG